MESVDETCLNLAKGESVQQVVNTGDEMNTGGVAYGDFSDSARLRKLDTFFSSGDMLYPRQFKVVVATCTVVCDSDYICRLMTN